MPPPPQRAWRPAIARWAEAQLIIAEADAEKEARVGIGKAIAIEGMQMMGGYGYATEYPMEGHLRRAIVGTVYGGTSEIGRASCRERV